MRTLAWLILAVALALGCHRHHGVNTSQLESTFKRAEPELRAEANKAIADIRAGKLTEALADLQPLARRAKLTAEQQQAVKNTLAQIQALPAKK